MAGTSLEGVVALLAGARADSIALVGFGIDSFVEMSSGLILLWRVRAERAATDEEAMSVFVVREGAEGASGAATIQ